MDAPLHSKPSSIPFEIRRAMSWLEFLRSKESNECRGPFPIPRTVPTSSSIAELIRLTMKDLPDDLQQKLCEFDPEQLAKLVMMNWIDHITDERKQAHDEVFICFFFQQDHSFF